MPLIKKKEAKSPVTRRLRLNSDVWDEIEKYMLYADLDGDSDLFFEESAKITMKKDKGFQKWKRELAKKAAEKPIPAQAEG